MASALNGLKDDMMDIDVWKRQGKATLGGYVGIHGLGMAVKLPYIRDQSPIVKGIAKGLFAILLGAATERYVGESFAAGFVGGAAGHAGSQIVNSFLPADYRAELGDYENMSALTPDERQFLNDLPGENLNEVSVETNPMLDEVSVEALQGAEEDDDDAGISEISIASLS